MITVRPARPDDAESITRIHLSGWERGYADLMPASTHSRTGASPRARSRSTASVIMAWPMPVESRSGST